MTEAVVRGLYEIIERDAYAIAYLLRLPSPKIQLHAIRNPKVKFFLDIAKRYSMELICLDFTTDINIPVIGALIIDRTGIGKAVSIGLKCDIDPVKALVGAISEAFHTKGWIRRVHEDVKLGIEHQSAATQPDFVRRGLWWYPTARIRHLNYWIDNDKYSSLPMNNRHLSYEKQLALLVRNLSNLSYDIYWKNLTLPAFRNLSYLIVKVIVPQLVPLVFDEHKPPLGSSRLRSVPKALRYKMPSSVNFYPHPFL